MINSPEELKHWYNMLVYHLTVSGDEKKLRCLLNDLLGVARPFADQEAKILVSFNSLSL